MVKKGSPSTLRDFVFKKEVSDQTQILSAQELRSMDMRQQEITKRYRRFQGFLLEPQEITITRKFSVGKQLGRGRQGVVFTADSWSDLMCHTRHAMKVFDPALFRSGDAYLQEMERIAQQVSMLQKLYHPNLVSCELFFLFDDLGILLMELIEGLDIRHLIDYERHMLLYRRIPLNEWKHFNTVLFYPELRTLRPPIVFYIVRKMLRGLDILHATGYIHCDIKPSNIMIDRFGTVKLIDFGRATLIANPGMHFLASPVYMAPELHERRDITPAADIYSVGIVLLEILYGKPIIPSTTTEKEIYEFKLHLLDHVTDYFPPKYRRNKQLLKIMQLFLHPDPNQRYPSAHEAEAGEEGLIQMQSEYSREEQEIDPGLELEIYISRCLAVNKEINKNLTTSQEIPFSKV